MGVRVVSTVASGRAHFYSGLGPVASLVPCLALSVSRYRYVGFVWPLCGSLSSVAVGLRLLSGSLLCTGPSGEMV